MITRMEISEYSIMALWAYQGVSIENVGFNENTGNMEEVILSYPTQSEIIDREGKLLQGEYLRNRVFAIARVMFPYPIKLDIVPREDEWNDEKGHFAFNFIIGNVIYKVGGFEPEWWLKAKEKEGKEKGKNS